MLPTFQNQVKPWFLKFGAIITDQQTLRHMINMTKRDIEGLRPAMLEYARASFDDLVAECQAEIVEAETVIRELEERLAHLEAGN